MKYLLSEDEYNTLTNDALNAKAETQLIIGELAEAKSVGGCPKLMHDKGGYPCWKCPEEDRCTYRGKSNYFPK